MHKTIPFVAALGLVALIGCSSSSPVEKPSSSAERLTLACVTGYTGTSVDWLVEGPDCACPASLTPDGQVECAYQQLAVSCLQQAGVYPASCSILPKLPRVSASDARVWTVIDLRTLSPDCGVQQQLFTCLDQANNAIGPNGWPFFEPPTDAAFRDFCDAAPPECGVPYLDVFDPCGVRSCMGQ